MCACANSFFKSFPQTRNQQKRRFFETFFAKSLHVSKIISIFAVG